MQQRKVEPELTGADAALLRSWALHLRSKNLSPRTVKLYLEHALALSRWLDGRSFTDMAPADVTAYLAALLERTSGRTAASHYSSLRQLFRWLHAEQETATDLFADVPKPKIVDKPPPVLNVEQLRAILSTCATRDFLDVRDEAMLRLFMDSGIRLSGQVQLTLAALSMEAQTITIVEKQRERTVPFGTNTAVALDRYLRMRRRHRLAKLPYLWLGHKGPLSESGVYQVVKRRAAAAGFDVHPHVLRHTFASEWLDSGGDATALMHLAGWKSESMVRVYGRSAAAARARRAHERHGLGDKL